MNRIKVLGSLMTGMLLIQGSSAAITNQDRDNYVNFAKTMQSQEKTKSARYQNMIARLKKITQRRMASGAYRKDVSWVKATQKRQAAAIMNGGNRDHTVARLAHVIVLVSFSMKKSALEEWMKEASWVGASVVIRGLVDNSFKATVGKIMPMVKQDHGGGIEIDPNVFEKMGVHQVPAVAVINPVPYSCHKGDDCIDGHGYDIIYGNTSLRYALNQIANRGSNGKAVAKSAISSLNKGSFYAK